MEFTELASDVDLSLEQLTQWADSATRTLQTVRIAYDAVFEAGQPFTVTTRLSENGSDA